MISGRRSKPDRPGHRVRLLLRPRVLRAQGSRVRDHHGQLQPGDRIHRLRHRRSALLRAADRRARARASRARSRRGTLKGVIVQFGGQTPLKIAAALEKAAFRSSARPQTRSIWPKTGSGSRSCSTTSSCCSPPTVWANRRRGRSASLKRSAIPCCCARPMCWVAGAWKSSTIPSACADTCLRRSRSPAKPGADRQLPARRHRSGR